jgi:hypothetical protein
MPVVISETGRREFVRSRQGICTIMIYKFQEGCGVDQLIVCHGRMLESLVGSHQISLNEKSFYVWCDGIFGVSPTATFHPSKIKRTQSGQTTRKYITRACSKWKCGQTSVAGDLR